MWNVEAETLRWSPTSRTAKRILALTNLNSVWLNFSLPPVPQEQLSYRITTTVDNNNEQHSTKTVSNKVLIAGVVLLATLLTTSITLGVFYTIQAEKFSTLAAECDKKCSGDYSFECTSGPSTSSFNPNHTNSRLFWSQDNIHNFLQFQNLPPMNSSLSVLC